MVRTERAGSAMLKNPYPEENKQEALTDSGTAIATKLFDHEAIQYVTIPKERTYRFVPYTLNLNRKDREMNMDSATRELLDFIAVDESAGNYNAEIGNAKSTRDLSKMTLSQIFLEERRLLLNHMASDALGKYQIIHPTLATLVARMRLPLATLFTPALQDELAVQLLVGRGYPLWWRKLQSDEMFAHNLSMEWASLPDPYNNGRSHYDGDSAGNHAGRTLLSVYDCLRECREIIRAGGAV